MSQTFNNTSFVDASIGDVASTYKSNVAVVTMVDVDVFKSASPALWGSGPLTYEIVVTNDETDPLSTVTFRDKLDPAYTELIKDSIVVDGTVIDKYDYNDTTGDLSFVMPNVPGGGGTSTITFQVSKR